MNFMNLFKFSIALEIFKTKSESLQSDSERMKALNQELTTLRSDFSAHLEKSKELEQKLSEKIITIDLQSEVKTIFMK